MHAFEKIANKFDTSFERKVEDAGAMVSLEKSKQELAEVKNESMELQSQIGGLPSIEVKDREYLEQKCKSMIEKTERILGFIEKDIGEEGQSIPLNIRSKFYDSWSSLVNAVSIQLRELRELNKMVMGIDMVNNEAIIKQMEEEQAERRRKREGKVSLSMSELASLVKAAENNNQLNAVDATFEIMDKEGSHNGKVHEKTAK